MIFASDINSFICWKLFLVPSPTAPYTPLFLLCSVSFFFLFIFFSFSLWVDCRYSIKSSYSATWSSPVLPSPNNSFLDVFRMVSCYPESNGARFSCLGDNWSVVLIKRKHWASGWSGRRSAQEIFLLGTALNSTSKTSRSCLSVFADLPVILGQGTALCILVINEQDV